MLSREYVNENGQLQKGKVWMTNQVGNLHCKALMHADGPKCQGGHLQEDSLLHNVCSNILMAAKAKNLFAFQPLAVLFLIIF